MKAEERKKICDELGGLPLEIFNELVRDCLALSHSVIAEITRAIEQQDFSHISDLAHSLKGASGNLRLNVLYEVCRSLEREANQDKDIKRITSYVSTIEKEVLMLEKEFK